MRWPDIGAAQAAVSDALGLTVTLRLVRRPLAPAELSAGERGIASRLGGQRLESWLLGRAALRAVLDGADTTRATFPAPGLSLTHGANLAVAARCAARAGGLGVDFEGWRPVDPRTARFYLADGEHADAAVDLLRLWTVKEALLKATLDNRAEGAVLLDYRVDDVGDVVGTATDGRGRRLRYVAGYLPEGPLAVAVPAAGGSGA